MALYCFDVDGTIDCKENDSEEYLKGVIKTDVLLDLEKQGHKIAIVSSSPFFPEKWKGDNYWFKRNADGFCRLQNIRDAQKYHGVSDYETIYIDDLKGVLTMIRDQSNITCFSPKDFLSSIQSINT